MSAFLVIEEGVFAGSVVQLDEGDSWTIGRDPDVCFQTLEDPMVSRKHLVVYRTDQGYFSDNLSTTNPAAVNGKAISQNMPLHEGDIIQVGRVCLRFTKHHPEELLLHEDQSRVEELTMANPTIYTGHEELDEIVAIHSHEGVRWIMKVISGPNGGAEFGIYPDCSYIIGKDPEHADFVFQDVTISVQHAKITSEGEERITIEDLKSTNHVFVNGFSIQEPTLLHSQDLISLGTTSILIVDRKHTRQTVVTPSVSFKDSSAEKVPLTDQLSQERTEEKPPSAHLPPSSRAKVFRKHWKQVVIPTHHLLIASIFFLLLCVTLGGLLNLFRSDQVIVAHEEDERRQIGQVLHSFPKVEHLFNRANGKLFLLGHLFTEVDHQELLHLLWELPCIKSITDNITIDELVWENTNALLMQTPEWRGVHLTSTTPGRFSLRGYVQTLQDSAQLSEYIHRHFSYLDQLKQEVIVEETLTLQIHNLLLQNQFPEVTFKSIRGELILTGHIPTHRESIWQKTLTELKGVRGVCAVKDLVVAIQQGDGMVDLSTQYQITGFSKQGKMGRYVVINGKILTENDALDGMVITEISDQSIFLQKGGVKYRVDYK